MADRVLLAQGREAEVFLQSDGTVLKLMREALITFIRRQAGGDLEAGAVGLEPQD